jgi:hypothetical protein
MSYNSLDAPIRPDSKNHTALSLAFVSLPPIQGAPAPGKRALRGSLGRRRVGGSWFGSIGEALSASRAAKSFSKGPLPKEVSSRFAPKNEKLEA